MAQFSAPLSKGETQLNFGAGFGSGFPVYGSMDIAVHDDITVGPAIGFNLNGFDLCMARELPLEMPYHA